MTDTLKSVVEEELQKAYERGVQDGMKQERALWRLAEIGQEIELGITYEEANPPEPYCKRCGKKLGTEAYDVHTCTPKEIQPVGRFAKFSDGIWKEVTAGSAGQPLYTAPPQREWVGLTDEERKDIFKVCAITDRGYVAAMVEAKLKEKNI